MHLRPLEERDVPALARMLADPRDETHHLSAFNFSHAAGSSSSQPFL